MVKWLYHTLPVFNDGRLPVAMSLIIKSCLFLLLCGFVPVYSGVLPEVIIPDEPLQELKEVEWQIKCPPSGIVFTIREYDEDALKWVARRLDYYIYRIRRSHPEIPIAIVSHGDEMASLANKNIQKYPRLHKRIQYWKKMGNIDFQVCGIMANTLGLSNDDFPEYIDVVPFGPSQIKDYRKLGFKHIELELSW